VAALGVLVMIVGFVAWRVRADRPPPPVAPTDDAVRAVVEADPAAADAAGQHLLDTMAPGDCLAPDSPELGPLAGVGAWTHVCVLGGPDGSSRQAKSDWVAGGVAIAFGERSPAEPDVCFRTVAGRWMEWYPAVVNPLQGCADGWAFQGA
jgi:hypothetical protein